MDGIGGQIGQRDENEPAQVEPRVRHLQATVLAACCICRPVRVG